MQEPERSLPQVFTRQQARALGFTDRQVDRRLATGRWLSLRRGHLTVAGRTPSGGRVDPQTVAFVLAQRRPVALSHVHAARFHGLPVPLGGLGEAVVTARDGPTRHIQGGRVVVAPLDDGDTVGRGRLVVTAVPRTVVDCLRTLPEADGLAVLDAALHRGLLTPAQLDTTLLACTGWPGAPRARAVGALGNGRRESPLESWSAWAFHREGVPSPAWQVDVLDATGGWLARVDCWWPEGVVGEADGRAKYRLAAAERAGADADRLAAVLHDERRREQRLRRTGAIVLRWGAADVRDSRRSARLGEQLRLELGLAGRAGRFRGGTAER